MLIRTKTIIAGLALLVGLGVGYQCSRSPPEIVAVETLSLNLDNNKRQVATKSLEDGLKDLAEIARTADQEEAYAFLPQTQEWIEVGVNENDDKFNGNVYCHQGQCVGYTKVSIDSDKLEELMKKHPEVRVYHIHPTDFAKKLIAEYFSQAQKGNLDQRDAYFQARQEVDFHGLPSTDDLLKIFGDERDIYSINPQGKLVMGVVAEDSVITFSLTDYGINYFGEMGWFKWQSFRTDFRRDRFFQTIPWTPSFDSDQNREMACETLSGPYLQVTYQRLNNSNSLEDTF